MASRVSYKLLSTEPKVAEGVDKPKLPPQMQTIIKTLSEDFKKDETVSRDRLVEKLSEGEGDTNRLNARQPVDRVVAFYQKRMAELGMIEVIKEAAPAKTKTEGGKATSGKAKVPDADPEATKASMKV